MRLLSATTALLLCLTASPATAGAQVPQAGDESRALAAHLEISYSAYLRDYIHVFLGHIACDYEFIDEDVLNRLADDVLRDMSQKAAELIRDEHGPGELSDAAVHYAARMAVLTSVEMWSNRISAELAPSYPAGTANCSASAAENGARYAALQRFELPQR